MININDFIEVVNPNCNIELAAVYAFKKEALTNEQYSDITGSLCSAFAGFDVYHKMLNEKDMAVYVDTTGKDDPTDLLKFNMDLSMEFGYRYEKLDGEAYIKALCEDISEYTDSYEEFLSEVSDKLAEVNFRVGCMILAPKDISIYYVSDNGDVNAVDVLPLLYILGECTAVDVLGGYKCYDMFEFNDRLESSNPGFSQFVLDSIKEAGVIQI